MVANPFEDIYKSATKFLTPLTLKETYAKIVEELLRISNDDLGIIVLFINGTPKRVYASMPDFPKVGARKRGFTYKAFRLGKPLVVNYNDIVKFHPIYIEKGLKWSYSIFIPLSYSNKNLGVLILHQKQKKRPGKKKLNMLHVFSSLATLAIMKMQLNEELKEAIEARELFVSMAAHELKTPLTTICAYVQLFQQNLSSPEINKKWVDQLAKATLRLKKLVLELLQVEQIKKGQLTCSLTKISLKEIIHQAVTDFIFFNPKHRIVLLNKLNGNKDLIMGDSDKLLQVFNNILNNAAKFSPKDKSVKLILEYKEPYYIIQVQDHGIGISKNDLNKVFDQFYKGNQKHREGLGIGLYLSKKIIKKHNGDISIISQKNKGTIVKIILPATNYGRSTRIT